MRKHEPVERERPSKGEHGPDWAPMGPEWVPPASPAVEKRPGGGEPAKKGDDAGSEPGKAGDPPIERPLGRRSRHGPRSSERGR